MNFIPIIIALLALVVVFVVSPKLDKSLRKALMIAVTILMLAVLVFEVISAYRMGRDDARQEKTRTQTAK